MKAFKAILFDLDGVIIDSEPIHEAAFQLTLKQYGHSLTANDYKEHYAGRTDSAGLEQYFKFVNEEHDLSVIANEKSKAYLELAASQLVPYEGMTNIIRELAAKYPLGLVTGSLRLEAEIAMQACDIQRFFTVVVTAEDVLHGKPDPEGYLLGAHKLGVSPAECLVIEDAPSGLIAANAAGMQSIAITNTHRSDELTLATKVVQQLSLSDFEV